MSNNNIHDLATLRVALTERLKLSEAIRLVDAMPTAVIEDAGRIAGALCLHPRGIAVACADPASGVARECMFKLTAADVHRWCERESEWMRTLHDRYEREAKLRNESAVKKSDDQITQERAARPSIEELKAKYGPTFGLGLKPDKVDRLRGQNTDTNRGKRGDEVLRSATETADRRILAEYARLGAEPKHFGEILVSPYLLKSMGRDVRPPQQQTNKNDDAEEA